MYPTGHTYRSRKWFKALMASIVLLLVIVWLPTPVSRPAKVAVTFVTQPLERIFSFLGFKLGGIFSSMTSIGNFKTDNARLLDENLQLRSQLARFGDIENENKILREELAAPKYDDIESVVADIIGWGAEDSGRWFTIDRGSTDGILSKMPVVAGGGVLVGQIDTVFPTSATVMLLTHPESVVNVLDENTEARGVMRGEYGLGLVFDMVPQTDILHSGDQVVTSGLGGELPRALVVGVIGEIRHTPDRLFQQATVLPTIDVSKLRLVQVIK